MHWPAWHDIPFVHTGEQAPASVPAKAVVGMSATMSATTA